MIREILSSEQHALAIARDSLTTYLVTCKNHDQGALGGTFLRKGLEQATRTIRVLSECGYQTITLEQQHDDLPCNSK